MVDNVIGLIPNDYIPISKVCGQLGLTQITLTRWYNWYEANQDSLPPDLPRLPDYYRATIRGTRYFRPQDIEKIAIFATHIKRGRYGIMASENYKYTSKYKEKQKI